MKKVICFCRVSTKHQDLENQRIAVLKRIKYDGFKDNEVIFVEGKESAIKLKEEERQTLNELKEIIEKYPTVEHIYFFAIDRLARRVSIVLSIVEYMIEKGVNLVFLNPYYMQTLKDGKEDHFGKMFLTFLACGAEMEMKLKLERWNNTRRIKKENKQVLNGETIFGYKLGKNNYPEEDEQEAEAIREIFALYIDGMSLGQIGNRMVLKGYFNNYTFKKNYTSRIHSIIKNLSYSGRNTEVNYPPIISPETQDKALAMMTRNKPKRTKNIFYAKGLLKVYDEINNKYYTLTPLYSLRYYSYHSEYVSTTSISLNVGDSIALMEATELRELVYENFQKNAIIIDTKSKINDSTKEIIRYDEIIKKIRKGQERLTNLYISGRITEERYEKDYNEAENKIRDLNIKIKGVEERIRQLEEQESQPEKFVEPTTDEEKAELCRAFIETIDIKKTGWGKYRLVVYPAHNFITTPRIYYYETKGGTTTLIREVGDIKEDVTDKIIYRFSKQVKKKKILP